LVTTRLSVFMSGRDVSLADKGRAQVHHLVEQVRPRRVAAVYSSRIGTAVESAELAASELGLASVVVDGLQDFSAGDLEEASLHDERRFAVAIGEITDVHRGEIVLVFSHGGAMSRRSQDSRSTWATTLRDTVSCPTAPSQRWRLTPTAGRSCPGPAPQNRREPTSSMPLSAS
jgi:broad specificity phosphatase PhoE